MGLFTVIYTTTGGMKAVMFTDVVQGIVIIIGIATIGYIVLGAADFDLSAIYSYAAKEGHGYGDVLTNKFWRFDLYDRFSFWTLLLYLATAPIQAVTADQSTVQRLLSSKGYYGARRAVIVQAFANIPIGGTLWLIGIGLFYYYGTNPGALPEGIKADQVFGYFINTQLPTPLPGLIVASLLAALMSTIDSTVNCIANVVHRDGLVRLGAIKENSPREMLICRGISVAAGVLGVGFAVFLTVSGENIKTSVLEISGIWASLWGVLMMPFVLGVLVPRVSGRPMFIGLLVGGITNLILPYLLYYPVPPEERISFLWVGVPGMLLAGIIPLVLSVVWPNRKNLTDLTHWTLKHKIEGTD
jgi:Na+/proline symporter